MICQGCGEKNRDGARFCLYCGASLALRCAVCDNELPTGARFCDSCGTPVDDPTVEERPAAASRKVVTVLFADLTGSTALEEGLDAETVRQIIDRYFTTLRTETERHGGRVVKFTGDGVMSVFGLPDVREDDAVRAVDAALAMRNECAHLSADLGVELAIKVAVNTGEVVVSEADEDIVGDSVNVAARLEGAAASGEILVGEETWRLTRGRARFEAVPPLTLKGKSEPVPAYRLLSVDDRTTDSAAAPFVGRDGELGRMRAVFEDAVASRGARLVTIIGSPGLGKTRLARELLSELEGDARVRETRCDPADSTFAPIADALRSAARITDAATEQEVIDALRDMVPADDPDRERIVTRAAAVLGVGQPGTTEETFWALRRLIEAAASDSPVVLVFDDVHWAEPLLLDLIEHLAEWVRDVPVMLVATARPELRDLRPSFAEGGHADAVIALEGLDDRATARLALNLLGTEDLPGELLAKIPASTEGNPLFVRELVRMLVDDGVLVRTGDGWRVTVDVEAIQVPPTIQSLLAARVDRLRSDERVFIELASIVGKEFYRGALHELAPAAVREQVDGCLESLRRKELVEPAGTYWIDEPVYHFHHALIRDAAYRRVLKETRADVHERVAAWLERKTQDVLGEHDELIGFHLEQAREYKTQLGRHDAELAARASRYLGSAAARAVDRDDLRAAASLSERALAQLGDDGTERAELLLIRCEALLSIGDVANGAPAVDALERLAGDARLAAWSRCFRGQLSNLTSPERLRETRSLVADAARELAELGDQAGAAKGHTVHAATLARLGRFGECEAVLDAGLNAAREAHDRRRITAVLGSAPHAALWGPNPVSRAGGRCLDIIRLLRITTGSPAVEATSNRCQAVLESFRGRADAARKMLRNSRRSLVELGLDHELLEADLFAGMIELVSGEASAAEPFLRSAYDGFSAEGIDVLAAQSAALLARALLSMDETAEAERFADASERLGGQDLKASIAWRAVKAELIARRGNVAEARRLAEAAVAIASETDALMDHADACRALAFVCAAAGDAAAARSANERALALYERKGATALVGGVAAAVAEPPVRAELDRRSAPASGDGPQAGACSLANDKLTAAFAARDWDAVASVFAPNALVEDRRPGLRNVVSGRDAIVSNLRELADVGGLHWEEEHVASRGDRLALYRRWLVVLGRDVDVPVLDLSETDEAGQIVLGVHFDAEDLEAALAELDRRAAASGRTGVLENRCTRVVADLFDAFARRDLEAFLALHASSFVHHDHRTGVRHVLRSHGELVENVKAYWDVGGIHAEIETIAIRGDRLALNLKRYLYADDAGEASYEAPQLIVDEIDEDGRVAVVHVFDPEDIDEAYAVLDGSYARGEGARSDSARPAASAENTASRAVRGVVQLMFEQDWDEMRRCVAPDAVMEDLRSSLQHTHAGVEAIVDNFQVSVELGIGEMEAEVIATRGDRLAVLKGSLSRDGEDVVDITVVGEVDENGVMTGGWVFDDIAAALAKLEERHRALVNVETTCTRQVDRFQTLVNTGDVERAFEACHRGIVLEDRRPGLGSRLEGYDAVLDNMLATMSLHPTIAWQHVMTSGDRFAVVRQSWSGTSPIEFDAEILTVFEIDEGGLFTAVINFDAADIEGAMAELDRRVSGAGTDVPTLRNRAVDSVDRRRDALFARDWATYEAAFAPDSVLEDRRAGMAASLRGVEERRRHDEVMLDIGVTVAAHTPIATRGDRLALVRLHVAGEGTDNFAELLMLEEIDGSGRNIATVLFDLDDLDAAHDELERRFAIGTQTTATRQGNRLHDAFNRADWAAFGELLGESSLLDDRRTGFGGFQIRGREARVENMRAIVALGGIDMTVQVVAAHGDLQVLNRFRVGGPDTYVEFLQLDSYDADGRLASTVLYDLEAEPEALADLDRVSAGPTARDLENQVVRTYRASYAAASRREEGWAERYFTPDLIHSDRRRGLAWDHSGEPLMKVSEDAAALGVETASVVATRGDRLALLHQVTRTAEAWEFETITLFESAPDGRIMRATSFDLDDIDDAFDELEQRHIRGEGAAYADLLRRAAEQRRAVMDGDMDAYRALVSPDVVLVDHRPNSLGTLRGVEETTNALRGLASLVRHARLDVVAYHALSPDRSLAEVVASGRADHGGDVEIHHLRLQCQQAGRVSRMELFPSAALDAALARFDELGRDPA